MGSADFTTKPTQLSNLTIDEEIRWFAGFIRSIDALSSSNQNTAVQSAVAVGRMLLVLDDRRTTRVLAMKKNSGKLCRFKSCSNEFWTDGKFCERVDDRDGTVSASCWLPDCPIRPRLT
jgi:hypothetical protein